MNICVVGGGYVGLTTAVGFGIHGHKVTCVESVPERVRSINQGIPPFSEAGLSDALTRTLASGHFRATEAVQEAVNGSEVIFVCVDTPMGEHGGINLSTLRRAITQIAPCMRSKEHYQVIAVKSTVVPTTTENVVLPLLSQVTSKSLGLCVNPEFLRQGKALEDFLHPDRIVIGAVDTRSSDILATLYEDFGAPIIRTSPATAEMIKYTSNALLATAISFSNEVANICELVPGVDVQEVMDVVQMDRRLSPEHRGERIRPGFLDYLVAGSGFGGSCLPKDLKALQAFARQKGYQPALLEAVEAINTHRPVRLVDMAERALGLLNGKRVAVLGLAFKPETDDMRDSPAIPVVEELLQRGAVVVAYDPQASENAKRLWRGRSDFSCASSAPEALAGADAAIVVTGWREFIEIPPETLASLMHRPIVVDGRRILQDHEGSSWHYLGIGRGIDTLPPRASQSSRQP